MRISILLILIAFLAGGCSSSGSKTGSRGDKTTDTNLETGFPEENLKLVHLDVGGMTCEGSEKAIVTSISKLDGIQEATASHTAQEAVVRFYATRTNLEAIAQAIADAGYSYEVLKTGDTGSPTGQE